MRLERIGIEYYRQVRRRQSPFHPSIHFKRRIPYSMTPSHPWISSLLLPQYYYNNYMNSPQYHHYSSATTTTGNNKNNDKNNIIKDINNINNTNDINNSSTNDNILCPSLSKTEIQTLNSTSAYLYRMLLQRLKQSKSSNTKSSSDTHQNNNSSSYILLQPPINPREYGIAKLFPSHECIYDSENSNEMATTSTTTTTTNTTTGSGTYTNSIIDNIYCFFLYWSEEDDADTDYTIQDVLEMQFDQDEDDDEDSVEQGENENDNQMEESEEEEDNWHNRALWVSHDELYQAINDGFLRASPSTTSASIDSKHIPSSSSSSPTTNVITKSCINKYHRGAIQSLKLFESLQQSWKCTSVTTTTHTIHPTATTDTDNINSSSSSSSSSLVIPQSKQCQVRVIATSMCIGVDTTKSLYRFAYRIRIENKVLSDSDSASLQSSQQDNWVRVNNGDVPYSVQLLGRTWNITEDPIVTPDISSSSNIVLPSTEYDDQQQQQQKQQSQPHEEKEEQEEEPKVISVNAPTTGAVGQQPVIHPGQTFEYISGCEIHSPTGQMDGYFHMAMVPLTTPSAQVGDVVSVLQSEDDVFGSSVYFKVCVDPFLLIGDE